MIFMITILRYLIMRKFDGEATQSQMLYYNYLNTCCNIIIRIRTTTT